MRKSYSILFAVIISASVYAQAPQKMSYQAVIRNSSNQLVTTHAVGMKISILQGSATGTAVYTEIITPTPSTNANGLVSIEIGSGAGFNTIDWSSGLYYIKTETDPTGGMNYTITGITQLTSVPYALYSKTSKNVENEIDPLFIAWNKSSGINITASQISDFQTQVTNNTTVVSHTTKLATISGTNTGDETNATIKSKLGITTLAGVNTGDQDLSGKVDKITGKGLSTNDYTDVEKTKLSNIAAGAEVNVNADWNATSGDAQILNKPTITVANGAETKIIAGTNISVTGTGTVADPYIVNSTLASSYYLGQEKDGGIIFYIYKGNDGLEHGLIVSKTEATVLSWGMSGTIRNATKTSNGAYNTNLMGTTDASRMWVYSLGSGWYLPSIDELSLLWQNRFHINNSNVSGLTLLSTYYYYWTSTEYSADNAYAFAFVYGSVTNLAKSTITNMAVRAIRSF